jgi:hypothetical protein
VDTGFPKGNATNIGALRIGIAATRPPERGGDVGGGRLTIIAHMAPTETS